VTGLGEPFAVAATTIHCAVEGCIWKTTRHRVEEAAAAGVWHVYEQHRAAWVEAIGEDRPPIEPRPEAVIGLEGN
jgi:hypothetical protein